MDQLIPQMTETEYKLFRRGDKVKAIQGNKAYMAVQQVNDNWDNEILRAKHKKRKDQRK